MYWFVKRPVCVSVRSTHLLFNVLKMQTTRSNAMITSCCSVLIDSGEMNLVQLRWIKLHTNGHMIFVWRACFLELVIQIENIVYRMGHNWMYFIKSNVFVTTHVSNLFTSRPCWTSLDIFTLQLISSCRPIYYHETFIQDAWNISEECVCYFHRTDESIEYYRSIGFDLYSYQYYRRRQICCRNMPSAR